MIEVKDEKIEDMTDLLVEFCEKFSGWEGAVAKLGRLSPAQMRTIGVIGRNRNLRMKDIAEKMELTTGTVTVMVDRLQEMGLVERCRNEMDRRSYRIVLSSKGEEYFQRHSQKQRELVKRLALKLNDDEQDNLIGFLGRFLEAL
ncbi:transcriptional regulator, MarR family [Dethiosulfovibrio peptidovorans DSM 11002]|uniref:Transcriptional regulator, MarR family n=1 Tax=Dethiosulfovibrio peptidovorans DSM 11002 TaxID=469381 RepID=D2Z8V4_9BACT|nr:MarR family transcriptional regulator [Dethiosulfovibrio peptidovorans]EFC91901.1 transcriptional regulator, MarR family [Dethiosulfovibrio peptidovorans DSM 11002]